MKRVLILGGYGNFGSRIATQLVKSHIPIIIAGRDIKKAEALKNQLVHETSESNVEIATFNANQELDHYVQLLRPTVIINTIGPYQIADYTIAKIAIHHKIHYIDLADARDFVTNIGTLNSLAVNNNVCVISGASTVPGLSSAVLEQYKNDFAEIDSLVYGISPGQKAPRGLATTESILTYLGKPLKPWEGNQQIVYGWQNIYRQKYPELGKRWMANCDIPDLDLFPHRYGIKHIRFGAGMENSILHLGMWVVSYLVRAGIPLNLTKHAKLLLALSHVFDALGTENGGMHMLISGKGKEGKPLVIKWFIVAKNNDGPQIPCVPAIILSKKLISGELSLVGALPCVGLISLKDYLNELTGFAITEHVFVNAEGIHPMK